LDLRLWVSVLWRFRWLVAAGVLLAAAAAVLSLARVTLDGGKPSVSYRSDEVWQSTTTLLVTQQGFPWGRAVLDEMLKVQAEGTDPTLVPRYGDAGRYASLAAIYAELAKSDAVQRQVLAGASPGEKYDAQVVSLPGGAGTLPMVGIAGYAASPERAEETANKAADAFLAYLSNEQALNRIPADKRIEVTVIKRAADAQVFASRSIVRPMFLSLLILMVFVGLAFVLENLRPRAGRGAATVVPADIPARARRSA
jgi:hypothetical protein